MLFHLWNENQSRGDRQRRAPSPSHQASYRHNLTLYDGLMIHTHTYYHSNPTFSLHVSFFFVTSAQNRPDSHTFLRLPCSARHVWPHCQKKRPWLRWTHTKNRKSSTSNTSGERFSKCNKEALQYNSSIIYCDMTDVFLSFLWVEMLHFVLYLLGKYLCCKGTQRVYNI